MEFARLVDGVNLDADLRKEIDRLLSERRIGFRVQDVNAFVQSRSKDL